MAIACNLIVDSCADLPASLLCNREGVDVLNFTYMLDGKEYLDDMFESISPKEFYDDMRFGGAPQTSQVKPVVLQDYFTRAAATGLPTIFFCFASALSGTYDSACMVAQQVMDEHPGFQLYVIDTALASVAEGSFVEEAFRMQANGFTVDEMLAWAKEARARHCCQFMVEDLDTLHRGGRLPGSVAAIGGKLDVKPMLTIADDGSLSVCGISRGRKKGMKSLLSTFTKNVPAEFRNMTTVVIGHADCLADAELLKAAVLKEAPTANIIVSNIGPVIGSHVGPGMLAISFFKPAK